MSAVETLVNSAWRRRLFVLTTEQLAFALAIVCAGAILMLLLGTQILNWYWLILLAAVGIGIAAARIRRQLVKRYDVARIMDERLHLSDSLSTAWFLLTDSSAPDSPVARRQISQAEQIAAGILPVSAFPVIAGRAWAVAGAMAAVIFGLFAVRYLVNSTLSLRPALVSLNFGPLADRPAVATPRPKQNPTRQAAGKPVQEMLPGILRDSKSQALNPQRTLPSATDPKSDQNANAPGEGKSSQSDSATQPGTGPKDGSSQSSDAASRESGPQEKPGQRSDDTSGSPQQKSRDQNQMTQQHSPGLMDKMKDALSSLMAKMKPNSASDSSSRDGKNTPGDQQGKNQNSAAKNQQPQSQDGQKAQGAMDAQSSTQASAVEKTPPSALGSSNAETPQSKTSDPQSGAGRQDGQKEIKEADQLKAMGKLAEIIGKRSASLTGEIQIEKPSEQQQLQTQYSGKQGQHANLGGEINRDEVPAEYQKYVREYMNQVHKQANAK